MLNKSSTNAEFRQHCTRKEKLRKDKGVASEAH